MFNIYNIYSRFSSTTLTIQSVAILVRLNRKKDVTAYRVFKAYADTGELPEKMDSKEYRVFKVFREYKVLTDSKAFRV